LSRAEEITSEVRRLVMTCRALEAQLKQSVPKKEYEEALAKKQAEVDALSNQLTELRAELDRIISTSTWAQDIRSSLDSQKVTLNEQTGLVQRISERIDKGTVPNEYYTRSLERIRELEAEIQELKATTVPRSDYEELKEKIKNMVPAEQLSRAQSRIQELETSMSNYVPRKILDELKSEITSLVREALATVVLETTAKVQQVNEAPGSSEQMVAVKIIEQIEQPSQDSPAVEGLQTEIVVPSSAVKTTEETPQT
jgi:chromosome segregation ATPase